MNQTIEYRDIHGNRNYKDSLFRTVFKKKRDQLMERCRRLEESLEAIEAIVKELSEVL